MSDASGGDRPGDRPSDASDSHAIDTHSSDAGSSDANSNDANSIDEGRRLIRLSGDRGQSLATRLAHQFYRLTWRTPLHKMRLKGRYPLKLLAVPHDPLPGNPAAGKAIRAGHFLFRGLKAPLKGIDFAAPGVTPPFAHYIHSFAWLRDLAAVAPREEAAPIAERLTRKWLAAHGTNVTEPAWTSDVAAWRILFWTAYAPLILSSRDIVYRSAVLNHIARAARHLDQTAHRGRPGVPQLVAWCGVVAAALLIPGGEPRRIFGEDGLKKSLEAAFYGDGGAVSRSPHAQIEAISALTMLSRTYDARRIDPPAFIGEMLALAVPALTGLAHTDGGLGSWQGGGATRAETVRAVVEASGVRARPLKQARDWGYQRLTAKKTVLLVDAAPPPVARLTDAGCASTLAFELSDGNQRIVVNCGGAALAGALIPQSLAQGLRTTAAHSTLVLADRNSTAILADGTLGKGVAEVEIERQEIDNGTRLEIGHDGYAKRLGFHHRRLLILSDTGRELRGEDLLLPVGRRKRPGETPFVIRFHLGRGISPTITADGLGALLRLPDGPLWQFRASAGNLAIEDSLWVDGNGRPHPTQQLALSDATGPGGTSIGWLFKHMG